jgi:hypothetical protein
VKLDARPSAVARGGADPGSDADSAGVDSADGAPDPVSRAPPAALPTPAAPFPVSAPARLAEAREPDDDPELRIARLEGKVAALEAALERRSGEVRRLQAFLCQGDLAQWTRQLAGLPPLPRIAYEPTFWHETRELTRAEVPETLRDLWSSLYPAATLATPRAAALAAPAAGLADPAEPAGTLLPTAAPALAAAVPAEGGLDGTPDAARSASPPRLRVPPQ